MGKVFGNLQRLTGVVYYVLSPHEIKPFTGVLNPGFRNSLRRFREEILWIITPISVVYIVRDLFKAEYEKTLRKNPEDYVNDV